MNDLECKSIDRLQKAHDDLKSCQFRMTLCKEDLPEYIAQLWELSDAWSNLCYKVDRPEHDKKLFREFCAWIHDYNSLLLRIGRNLTRVKEWLPYFEAMLNITHVYLDTGCTDVFYNPFVYSETQRDDSVSAIGERWHFVTKELCGIDSSELPRYFPVTLPLCTDTAKMKKYFLEKRYYGLRVVSAEQRLEDFVKWESDVRPVLLWINENLVAKSSKDSDKMASLYYAAL